jgi:hypothetical protein
MSDGMPNTALLSHRSGKLPVCAGRAQTRARNEPVFYSSFPRPERGATCGDRGRRDKKVYCRPARS